MGILLFLILQVVHGSLRGERAFVGYASRRLDKEVIEVACNGLREVCGDEMDDPDSCIACAQINELDHCPPKKLKAICKADYDPKYESELVTGGQSDKTPAAGDDDGHTIATPSDLDSSGDDDHEFAKGPATTGDTTVPVRIHQKRKGRFHQVPNGQPKVTHFKAKVKHHAVQWNHFKHKSVRLYNGVKLPQIGLGTWRLNGREAYIEQILGQATKAGFSEIDTAFGYDNEPAVGQAVFRASHPIFVTTKVPPCTTNDPRACFVETRKTFLSNLAQLQVPSVDLALLHSPNCDDSRKCDERSCAFNMAQWILLQKMYEAKKARAIGVSNYCQSCLKCMLGDYHLRIKPMVNQIQFHVGMGPDPQGLVSYCKSNGILVQAYSPLGSDGHITDHQNVRRIAHRMKKSPAAVALRWIVQQDHAVIVKTENRLHMAQDLDIFSWKLSDADMTSLSHVDKKHSLFWSEPSISCSG